MIAAKNEFTVMMVHCQESVMFAEFYHKSFKKKPKPPPRKNKPPPRPITPSTGSVRHIRKPPSSPGHQGKNLPSNYGKHRVPKGMPTLPVSSTDSANAPDIARSAPYPHHHQSVGLPIKPSLNARNRSGPQKSKTNARSAPKASLTKGNKSAPPSPMFTKRNSNSEIRGRDDEDEEKGPGYVSRWGAHPDANRMVSMPPGMHGIDIVNDLSNHNQPGSAMRPPPPPGSSNSHSHGGKKRAGNIAGFDDATLSKIDDCNLEALMGTMHEGSECLKHFQKAMSTFATQQQKQCNTFLKLFTKSKSRYAQIQSMPQFYSAVSLVHELLEETVRQSAEFAKFIEKSCLPMIKELDEQCTIKYQETYKMSKQDDKKLSDSKNEVQKARKVSKQAAEKVIIAREKKSVHQSNAKSGRNAQLLQKDEATIQATYTAAKSKEQALKQRVMEHEDIRRSYIDNRNVSKQDIIDMEHFRVGTMLSVVQKIINKQQSIYPSVNYKNKVFTLQQDIMDKTATMNAKDVILQFISANVETFGQWQEPRQLKAVLDVEYRDMFYSIDDAMEITLGINPNEKVPMLVPLLCNKIKDLNGFRTEGIFRKSPKQTQMLQIKERISKKDFNLTGKDPHVYAALLKDWLRGLQDFLIPKRYYGYCCDMAKEHKLNEQQFEVFFSQMPQVNRATLKYLIVFLRELLDEGNQQYTKMNLENIAIVFGPTLLMPEHELEPQVALMNAKYEKQFVMSLITDSQGAVSPM